MRMANTLTSCLRSQEEPQDSEGAASRSVNTSGLIHPVPNRILEKKKKRLIYPGNSREIW